MTDYIHDLTSGKPVARIDGGGVFSLETGELVGRVKNGQIFCIDGTPLSNLVNAFVGPDGGPTSEAFNEALRPSKP